VEKKFPAVHPQASHIPTTGLIPSSSSRSKLHGTVGDKEEPCGQQPLDALQQRYLNRPDYIHPADSPASAPEQTVLTKTRGSPYRHEKIAIPLDSERKPMTWPQGPNYFQVII